MRRAFTLAEVLITLAIIGIVAAITIPSVSNNVQQQGFKTGLQKAVSVLNEAITLNIQQDSETPYENQNLFNYLQKHMNILKTGKLNTCNDSSGKFLKLEEGATDCSSSHGNFYTNSIFYTTDGMRFEILTGGNGGQNRGRHYYLHETGIDAATAKRGLGKVPWGNYIMQIDEYAGFCGSYGLANNPNDTKNTPCIIIVDVNGDRKPNPPEKFLEGNYANQPFAYTYALPSDKRLSDIFTIMITDEKAVPFGVVAQRAMYEK